MLLLRVQEQLRISHRAIDCMVRDSLLQCETIRLQKKDSLLQCETIRLQKKAFMNLQAEVERLNSEKQQGHESHQAGDLLLPLFPRMMLLLKTIG